MKRCRLFPLLLVACSVGAWAQVCQAPATTEELTYFRFMLLNLGQAGSSSARQQAESHLAIQFGLNQQEVGIIDGAAQQMASLLQRENRAFEATSSDASGPSAATVENLAAQREQVIVDLAARILNSVRPETADQLRVPGHIVANAVHGGGH